MSTPTVWISCGVLRNELETLHRQGGIEGELQFLDSMLHMVPQQLQTTVETALRKAVSTAGRVVLVYGDCCSRMLDLVRQFRVGRVNAINCAQMLVGRTRYRELMQEQAFMLLPEWATRWQEIMQNELGLSPEVACDLMRDNRRELVYLDTGLVPIPEAALADCSAYTGLPCRIESVKLDNLLVLLREAESAADGSPLRIESRILSSGNSDLSLKPASFADQLMAVDVFSELLASTDPKLLGRKLTEQLRELTGARTVMLIAQVEATGPHQLIHVCPDRRITTFTAEEITSLCSERSTGILLRRTEDFPVENPLRQMLLRAGVMSLLRFPLRVEEDFLATLLLLDLPGLDRIDETAKIVTHLSPAMALALRNSFAHKRIEQQARELKSQADELERRVVDRTVALQYEIAERKAVEKSLRESERNFRLSLDGSPLGVRIVSASGNTIYANQALLDIYGYESIEELRATSAKDRYTAESYAEFLVRKEKRQNGNGAPSEYEISIFRKDGEIRRLEVFRKEIVWNGDMQYQVLYNDITRRKKAEEQLHHTLENLRKAVRTTIQVMVAAVEIRDPYTSGHQFRSADLARAIAGEMGLSQERIDGIHMAGRIHDLGKMSVPAEILSKPTTLSELEYSLIQAHAEKGFEMLKDVESPWPLAEIVYQHHERMDGSGYPRKLKGEEIILEARILAVADVVESMASHRPYRAALGLEAALAEIEHNKGTFYDAEVVDACLRLFRERGFQFEGIKFQ